MEVNGELHAPTALLLGKEYIFVRGLVGPRADPDVWQGEESLPLLGIEHHSSSQSLFSLLPYFEKI
jgi:hypothetical protein